MFVMPQKRNPGKRDFWEEQHLVGGNGLRGLRREGVRFACGHRCRREGR